VKPLRHQFLAGAALADHQHGAIERGGAAGTLQRIEKRAGLADDLGCSLHCQRLA
jgi:hypothetical protein